MLQKHPTTLENAFFSEKGKNFLKPASPPPINPKEVVMKQSDTKKVLSFPTHSAAQPNVSIHPDQWAEAIRPTDDRDLRLEKIAALRTAIDAGTYRISSASIAEKLIHHMRDDA